MLVPFYPCSYRCERALAWARASFGALAAAHPLEAVELRTMLLRPVLYLDHDHQFVMRGTAAGDEARYSAVAIRSHASTEVARFGRRLAWGSRLRLTREALQLTRDGTGSWRLARREPVLGFLAAFSDA